MKIAIDLRPLQIGHENRGIGTYLRNILQDIPADTGHEYLFLRYDTDNPLNTYRLYDGEYQEIVFKKYPFKPKPMEALKFLYGLGVPKYIPLLAHRPDVFFQSDYLLGLPSRLFCKSRVVVCYDLIPILFRSMYLKSWKHYYAQRNLRLRSRVRQSIRAAYYERKYRKGLSCLRKSDKVLSISNSTTEDILALAGTKRSKIKTTPLAASYTNKTVTPATEKLLQKISGNYIFYIGGADKRREILVLISAFNKLRARGRKVHLVLAGNEFTENSKIVSHEIRKALFQSSYKEHIHLLGKISDGDKYHLMNQCGVFVYPSLYEGFGIPILEAMEASAPILSYRNSSIGELGGVHINYCQEHNSDAMSECITEILGTTKAGSIDYSQVTNKYSWNITNKLTWDEITSTE